MPIADGWPPAYARAAASNGPITVLTFRATGPEHESLRAAGHPFFVPVWWPDIAGVVLDDVDDWVEIAEFLTESYRLVAPRKLRDLSEG